MPIKGYGVLTAKVVERKREGAAETPHYQVLLEDPTDAKFRAAVNVLSQEAPSELMYVVVEDFQHPLTAEVAALGSGWHALESTGGGVALDYVRGNLFDASAMRMLPPDAPGADNDLPDLLDHYVQRAIGRDDVTMSVFGQRWGPEDKADQVFGFKPGDGVHGVHMNQGNSAAFARDDGVWQDGGLLLNFTAEARWVAVFLAFQSQKWHTDDATGHALGNAPQPPSSTTAAVRILAAMVNPVGPAPERESVLLMNASAAAVDLNGWRIADRTGLACALPSQTLSGGATLSVLLTDGVALGNAGGTISLLDASGLKVMGVAYTAQQAAQEGWTVTF